MGKILAEMKERGERDTGKGNRNPALKSQGCYSKALRPRHQQDRVLAGAEAHEPAGFPSRFKIPANARYKFCGLLEGAGG